MKSHFSVSASLFTLFGSAMASPIDPVRDLRCYCMTFSPLADTTPCEISVSRGLDWRSTQSFASDHDLKIQFASESTISKMLEAEEALPTSVLLSLNEGEALPFDPNDARKSASKMVCGIGDEVTRKWMEDTEDVVVTTETDRYVSKVVAVLILLIIVYASGEAIWIRYFKKNGHIKLSGDEQDLTSDYWSEKCSMFEDEEKGIYSTPSSPTEYP